MAPMLGGRIDIQYRRVQCTPPSNLQIIVDKNSGTGGFLKMSVTVCATLLHRVYLFLTQLIHMHSCYCQAQFNKTAQYRFPMDAYLLRLSLSQALADPHPWQSASGACACVRSP